MKQFMGFQNMMQNSLDSLNAMGAWQVFMDKAFTDLRERADGATTSLVNISKQVDLAVSRMDSLETRLVMASATAPI